MSLHENGDGSDRADADASAPAPVSSASAHPAHPPPYYPYTPLLLTPLDERHLSPQLCLIRSLLRFFPASPEDMEVRRRKGGAKRPLLPDQVGICCVHCAPLPPAERPNGAVSYPKNVGLVHQAVRNWQRFHLWQCPNIPQATKDRLQSMGRGRKQGGPGSSGAAHWVHSCTALGIRDCPDGEGIEFGAGADVDAGADNNEGRGVDDVGGPQIMLPPDDLSALEPNPVPFGPPDSITSSTMMLEQEQMMGALDGTLVPSEVSEVGATHTGLSYASMAATAAAEAPSLEDHTEAFSNLQVDLAELDFDDDGEDFLYNDEDALNSISQASGGKPASIQSSGGANDNDALTEDLTHSCEGSQTSELTLSSEHAQLLALVRSGLDLVVAFRAEHLRGGGNGDESAFDDAELHEALGRALYKHFSGNSSLGDDGVSVSTDRDDKQKNIDAGSGDGNADDDIEESAKRKGRRTAVDCTANSNDVDRSGHVPLLDFGYPIRLSTMVDCLVQSRSSLNNSVCSFASTEDVEEELRDMLEKPGQYLYDTAEAVYCGGQLRFAQGKLYGRSEEVAILMSAYDRVIQSKKEKRGIALINGYAGTGKSSLVDQILPRLNSDRASFVYCKFDIQGQKQPMSSFFRALDGYCQNLIDGDPTLLAEIRGAIIDALGPSVSLLKGQVPFLGAVLGLSSPVLQAAETTDALNHISYSLRLFVRAISGPTYPLVFLFDDLQYADKNSVDVINLLLKDAEATSLLFIGCYREESVSIDHPLTEGLGEVAMAADMPMMSITLSNLDQESVNDMVSETLNMSRRLTRPLADALMTKTSGNPMFVRQLMASLNADGLIFYSATFRRWCWDIKAIREKDVADEVVDLLVGRMKGYGPEVELLLQVAACFGTSFDPKALCLCFTDDGNVDSIDSSLMRLMADGLINKVGGMHRFGHDLIWQAAYALTPSPKQQSMHLHVGRQLLKNRSEEEHNQMVSIIADQLNRGVELIADGDERLLLARMNLQVGQKELISMSFLPASMYLLQGTILVRDEDWEGNYEMCLQLFTSCAEVQLALGNDAETVSLATQVLTLGRSLQDKLGAYHALIKAKISQGDTDEPVKIGLSVLEQLGESFPVSVDQAKIGKELMETQQLLESSSLETMLKADVATDADRVATMRFLLLVSTVCSVPTVSPSSSFVLQYQCNASHLKSPSPPSLPTTDWSNIVFHQSWSELADKSPHGAKNHGQRTHARVLLRLLFVRLCSLWHRPS